MIDETVAKIAAARQHKIFAVRLRGRLCSWHLGGNMRSQYDNGLDEVV